MASQPKFSRGHLKELKLWKQLMEKLLKSNGVGPNRRKVVGASVWAGQLSWCNELLTVGDTEQMYLNPETLRVQVRRFWPTGKWKTLSFDETAAHITSALNLLDEAVKHNDLPSSRAHRGSRR